ncbi:MAG: hypothetical protein AB1756_05455 [Acidobacteriota bacterium]
MRGFYPSLVISFVTAAIIVFAAILKFSSPSPGSRMAKMEAKQTILEEIARYEEPLKEGEKPETLAVEPDSSVEKGESESKERRISSDRIEKSEEASPLKRGREFHISGNIDLAAREWGRLMTSGEVQNDYTIQLLIACQRQTILRAFKNVRGTDKLFYVKCRYKEMTCYKLCMGIYTSRSEAEAGRLQIPEYFTGTGNRPMVTSISKLRESIILK